MSERPGVLTPVASEEELSIWSPTKQLEDYLARLQEQAKGYEAYKISEPPPKTGGVL